MTIRQSFKVRLGRLTGIEKLAIESQGTDVKGQPIETEKVAKAREGFANVAGQTFRGYKMEGSDFDDPQIFSGVKRAVLGQEQDDSLAYFNDYRNDIFGLVDRAKYAENAFQLPFVMEIEGDEDHNRAVEALRKSTGYGQLIAKVKEKDSPDEKDIRTLQALVLEDVEEVIANPKINVGTNDNPVYEDRVFNDETKNVIRRVSELLAGRSIKYGLSAAKVRAAEESSKFAEVYGGEAGKALYAEKTLRAYADKGDNEALETARILDGMIE
jgi:hypothetical protein